MQALKSLVILSMCTDHTPQLSYFTRSVQCNVHYRYNSVHAFESCGWLCDKAVERRSLAGELSLFCARPVADR